MPVFKDYSNYYNLLYKDKDYAAEVNYITRMVNDHNPESKTVLNLGCGTGNHDFIFADKGYNVVGADLSEDMIKIANDKKQKLGTANIDFITGDARTLSLKKEFDVVLSLFHVMSYQSGNDDLEKAFNTAYTHAKKGGLFIFDCWYGPGVLTDRPTVRDKQFENDEFKVNRLSTPTLHVNDNCVDVEFKVDILNKTTSENYKITELHKMRYLFLPELNYFLSKAGFTVKLAEEWLSGKTLTEKSWNATLVCIKN